MSQNSEEQSQIKQERNCEVSGGGLSEGSGDDDLELPEPKKSKDSKLDPVAAKAAYCSIVFGELSGLQRRSKSLGGIIKGMPNVKMRKSSQYRNPLHSKDGSQERKMSQTSNRANKAGTSSKSQGKAPEATLIEERKRAIPLPSEEEKQERIPASGAASSSKAPETSPEAPLIEQKKPVVPESDKARKSPAKRSQNKRKGGKAKKPRRKRVRRPPLTEEEQKMLCLKITDLYYILGDYYEQYASSAEESDSSSSSDDEEKIGEISASS